MLLGSRLNGDKPSKESVVKTMRKLVNEYMAALDQDKADGLDQDTAWLWKEQVQGIVAHANLDQPAANDGRGGPDPAPLPEATDCLGPLKCAIDQARYTAFAAARELTDPEETVLRGFGKQLGSSKKEIMALSKDLAIGQPADVAMEATRLASTACDAIKASRESIRAALRELGAASDVSEASGPTRARPQQQERPAMGRLDLAGQPPPVPMWPQRPPPPSERAAGTQSAAPEWYQCLPPPKSDHRKRRTQVAPNAYAGRLSMASSRIPAKTQDEGGRRGVVDPNAGHDEHPGKRQRVAHFQ